MDKKEFDQKTYIDRNGYRIWKSSNKSVHRTRAFNKIYLKDRKKYPLKFTEYQVHHKDKDKLNNRLENLEILEKREHEKKHNIERHEYKDIRYLIIWTILAIVWYAYLGWKTGYRYDREGVIFMISTFILAVLLVLFLNRKKKGRRYV